MFDKNSLCSLFLGFILGYSVNYYNIKYIQNIEKRLEIIETKNLFLNGDINDLKLKIVDHKSLIKELNEKQESLIHMKKKKINKIDVQYEDVDFGLHTPQ